VLLLSSDLRRADGPCSKLMCRGVDSWTLATSSALLSC
jgi:hypothetical protein